MLAVYRLQLPFLFWGNSHHLKYYCLRSPKGRLFLFLPQPLAIRRQASDPRLANPTLPTETESGESSRDKETIKNNSKRSYRGGKLKAELGSVGWGREEAEMSLGRCDLTPRRLRLWRDDWSQLK